MSKYWIHTFTNKLFDLENPTPEMVCIEDIAHHLSGINRFTGAAPSPYNVAQHSVLMSWYIDTPHKFTALMHDSQEAYVGDMTSPLKRLMRKGYVGPNSYDDIEERVWHVIAQKYNVPFELPAEVKEADLKILANEKLMFGEEPQSWNLNAEPFVDSTNGMPIKVNPWTAKEAEREFLIRFEQLERRRRSNV